ncbi:MAG: SIR2 family protein, partial [Planctomycetes bacterium]|nr:SIR2 family protein [Planctomycetota bacterium]
MSLPTALQPLAKLLEKDEPKVLVVVGAGISMGATSASHASLVGLLKHGLKHLVTTGVFTERWGNELSDSLNAAFSPFDLDKVLQHAELVEQNLRIREEAFAEWLRAAFRDFKVQPGKNQTFDALRDLQQAGALVLTTNYDNLLSEVTGVPPVTWEEHADFLQVINRRRSGILHIHGHWKRPTSVVLGKSSYERIVGDPDFQTAFKCLLLQWSWLFVGCGDGLDDPNLGPLLEWGKRWGHGKQSDYFLAIADKAQGLANRPDKPPYLVSVGYPDHLALPGILHSLTPSARCRPFIPVDKDFELFRSPASPLSNPFPSQQEYLDGEVPALAADAEVRRRLKEHGWAFVLDVATVGKTTLALRLATSPEQRDHPTYYLDLGTIIPDDADSEVAAAMRRLSRPNSLLILDNVHHLPELARQLWNQWRDRPCGTSLLLVATRIQRTVMTAPAQDLVFFEHHATNPAIKIQSTPEDLGAIVKHLYRRVGGGRAQPLPTPSPGVLQRWYRDYRSALSAFCLAALRCLDEFRRDNWDLPIEAASDWVREKWFDKLNAENQENAICLAVFGAQELEIQVAKEALPYPDKTDQLLRQGLVGRIERGQFGQYHRFSLREPSWGRLILAAVEFPIEKEETILFETAARHPVTTIVLSSRLRSQALLTRHLRFWAYLAVTPNNLVRMVHNLPLLTFSKLVQAAKVGQQPRLAHRFWEALEREPNRLAERAWETPLGDLASFLDTAKRHGRDVTALWVALEREPGKLAERAWETPLHFVASFLDTAKRHGRDVTALWVALEREPGKLAEHVWGTSLDHLAHFLKIAKGHGRDVTALWEALEREPGKLAERAWETPLHFVASFLDTAKRHGRDVTALWV